MKLERAAVNAGKNPGLAKESESRESQQLTRTQSGKHAAVQANLQKAR